MQLVISRQSDVSGTTVPLWLPARAGADRWNWKNKSSKLNKMYETAWGEAMVKRYTLPDQRGRGQALPV